MRLVNPEPRVSARRLRGAWLAAAAYGLLLLGQSSIPAPALPPPPFSYADKAAHLAIYLPLGWLLHRATGSVMPALALGAAFAVADECYQTLIPGRHPDSADAAADALGVLAGAALRAWWPWRRRGQATDG
jgi:VanZ family protein